MVCFTSKIIFLRDVSKCQVDPEKWLKLNSCARWRSVGQKDLFKYSVGFSFNSSQLAARNVDLKAHQIELYFLLASSISFLFLSDLIYHVYCIRQTEAIYMKYIACWKSSIRSLCHFIRPHLSWWCHVGSDLHYITTLDRDER